MKTRFVISALMMLGASFGAFAQDAGSMARSMFTTAIDAREPANTVDSVPADVGTVYFFTELRNFTDQTVTHRWTYHGQVMAEVPFNVRGARWRVWSSKNLQPIWTGDWTVTVVDAQGNELAKKTLTVADAAPAAETAEVPADEAAAAEMPAEAPAAEVPAAAEDKAAE